MAADDPRDESSDRTPEPGSGPEPDQPTRPDQPTTPAEGGSHFGDTVERPPADPWAEETAGLRGPAGATPPSYPDAFDDAPPTPPPGTPGPAGTPPNVGPTGTGVMPTVPGEQPRWSARAQVRSPGGDDVRPGEVEPEWQEPGRGPMVPILVGVVIVLLIGLFALGAYLLLNNGDEPNPSPSTPAPTSAAPTSAAPTSAKPTTTAPPTSAAPAQVEIPPVDGVDYDTAAAKLSGLGLTPKRVDEVSSAPAGRVIGTNPPAGNVVARGTTVEVRVSKGLPVPTTTTTTATIKPSITITIGPPPT